MMRLIYNKYDIGQIVYLKIDTEGLPRMVTSIIVRPNNQIFYGLSFEGQETIHYEIELITIDEYEALQEEEEEQE